MTDLSDIDRQIAELQAQKRKLLEDEKKSALKKVQLALEELNALGFNYSLTDGTTSTVTSGTRRSGVRQDVLKLIEQSPKTRADVLDAMDAKGDKKAEQSISNALANLKKSGKVTLQDGTYSTAS